ncbi:MAG: ComF family protein [Merismopedia sp. SIO2A8]|nr:ComF family protein [Merismopedia sp. SIO2A8]
MPVAQSLLSLFLKSKCTLCDRPAQLEFCPYCQRQLQYCQLDKPDKLWSGELPVFAWGSYGGLLKRAITALKYENQPQLAQPLGYYLGEAWLQSAAAKSLKKLIVMPIPVHPTKLRLRGYNQAQLIAQSFCQFTGYKQQPLALERVHATQAQFSLSRAQREQNLADAFVISKNFSKYSPASPVLLIDDIYTTGATVRSAAKTLVRQGIQVYGVAAIALSPSQCGKQGQ